MDAIEVLKNDAIGHSPFVSCYFCTCHPIFRVSSTASLRLPQPYVVNPSCRVHCDWTVPFCARLTAFVVSPGAL